MNRPITFRSPLADAMEEFVAFKRMQGYDYTDQARTLSYFDRFLATDSRRDETGLLTVDTLQRYVATTGNLAAFTRQTRIASLREFSRWLRSRCPASAMLPRDILPRCPRPVRFFRITREQVAALMAAAPVLLPANAMRARSLATLIGLLYSTGLRLAEALNLTVRDIATDGSTLHVAKGKFGKERLVPLSPSAYAAVTDYLAARRQHTNRCDSSPLFIDAGGAALTRAQVYYDYHRLCRHCGIQGQPPPRLHDLRHNYACRRLALWRQEGRNINALLPILATAMGHVSFFATQHYLHLDAVALQDAAALFNTHVHRHQESMP
jgi:integrase